MRSKEKTDLCKICFNPVEQDSLHSLLTRHPTICHKCLLSLEPVLGTFDCDGVECFHIYFYTDKVKELLYKFKGCYDYELRTVFFEYYANYLNLRFRGYTYIPAPSSKEGDEERGFNHVEEMFKFLRLPSIKCIHKTKDIKQADLTTKERLKIGKHLVIDDVDLTGKKILLVDDVFTTGSTIKSMIRLAREKGAKKIKVLVMSKTIDIEKRE